MLFSVVVGLPEGLMGFLSIFPGQALPGAPRTPASPHGHRGPPAARAADGSPLLVLDDLKRHFGGVKAVDGLSLTIRSGTIHGLIGPNGSGKEHRGERHLGALHTQFPAASCSGARCCLPAASTGVAVRRGRGPSRTSSSSRNSRPWRMSWWP